MTPGFNSFEFVIVVALRTKQLMAGCTPRVPRRQKMTRTAAAEVLMGKVARIPSDRH